MQNTPSVNRIIVATDCDLIEDIVKSFGFSKVEIYRRVPENATNTASTESVMLEYLSESGNEPNALFMLVQATSPLTSRKDFQVAIEKYGAGGFDSMLSCVRSKRFIWNENGTPLNYDVMRRPRRQEFSGVLLENGSFYINTVGNISKDKCRLSGQIGIHEMPEYTLVEIDEDHDWIAAEGLMWRYFEFLSESDKAYSTIRLVATDVDGVLTDAGMYYTEAGDELKKFNTRDGKGFELLKQKGIITAMITSENTLIVTRRAEKLKIAYLKQGVTGGDKLRALKEICNKEKISLSECAYIGDDINCVEVLEKVGFPFCPQDADEQVKRVQGICVLKRSGGMGAFRELVSIILKE